MASRRRHVDHGINEVNVTPLADVTTIFILVFLVTMPALLWNGIQVSAENAGPGATIETPPPPSDELLIVTVATDGITVNREAVSLAQLGAVLERELAARKDKTVLVVPRGPVRLSDVVTVLDIAKASGAEGLSLVNTQGQA